MVTSITIKSYFFLIFESPEKTRIYPQFTLTCSRLVRLCVQREQLPHEMSYYSRLAGGGGSRERLVQSGEWRREISQIVTRGKQVGRVQPSRESLAAQYTQLQAPAAAQELRGAQVTARARAQPRLLRVLQGESAREALLGQHHQEEAQAVQRCASRSSRRRTRATKIFQFKEFSIFSLRVFNFGKFSVKNCSKKY